MSGDDDVHFLVSSPWLLQWWGGVINNVIILNNMYAAFYYIFSSYMQMCRYTKLQIYNTCKPLEQ